MPVFTVFMRELINGGFTAASGGDVNADLVEQVALKFLYLAIGLFVVSTRL